MKPIVLACVATWADAVRNTHAYAFSKPYHFVNIPVTAAAFDPARDCPETKGCVISALDRYQKALADHSRPRAERAEALKFVVHLVGDLHQPLHNAMDKDRDLQNAENAGKNLSDNGEGDRGGNTKIVTWFGEASDPFGCWNLHAVWDDGMIERRDADEIKYAGALRAKITPALRTELAKGTTIDWVNEALKLAAQDAYHLPDVVPSDSVCEVRSTHGQQCTVFDAETCRLTEVHHRYELGQAYFDANIGIVERQLTAAGVRLARILSAILK